MKKDMIMYLLGLLTSAVILIIGLNSLSNNVSKVAQFWAGFTILASHAAIMARIINNEHQKEELISKQSECEHEFKPAMNRWGEKVIGSCCTKCGVIVKLEEKTTNE